MSNFYIDDGVPFDGRQKICLATTAYESPDSAYTFSIQKSREALHKSGFNTAYFLLSGNCHVDDARNSVVQEFLDSDCTDLVFIDSDVVWEPEELVQLCQFDVDIVGGVYPYRRENSNNDMPVMLMDVAEKDENGLLEVIGLPTGFMRIKRTVLETLAFHSSKYVKQGNKGTEIPIIFERTIDNGRRLGGDLNFCRKWREFGEKVYAAPELRLGHVTKTVLYDSLGASLRRERGDTLAHMVTEIQKGNITPQLFSEARKYAENQWGALEDILMICAFMAKKADGPILETGSGLSTIVMAAATDQTVYCLEHDAHWAKETYSMAEEAGVDNIEILITPIIYHAEYNMNWYEIPDGLPDSFALALNDGPPRSLGTRRGLFYKFRYIQDIICDDADDNGYREWLIDWSSLENRRIDFVERSAIIRGWKDDSVHAA